MTDKRYLFYIAEDDVVFLRGTPDEDQDDVYERFNDEFGHYPVRVCGVRSEQEGTLDVEVVWEAEDEDDEEGW